MLPRHETVDNLQCMSVKRGCVVYTQDVTLDLLANTMDVSKCGARPVTMILLGASRTHQSHILD